MMDINEDEFALTFNEIKHFNDNDIPLCLKEESALKICRTSYESEEVSGAEVIHLCVDKLLNAYEVDQFKTGFFAEFTKLYEEIMLKTFHIVNESLLESEDITMLLQCSFRLVEWLEPLFEKNKLTNTFNILRIFLHVGDQVFDYYEKGHISNQSKDVLNLIDAAETFLSKISSKVVLSNDEEFLCLVEIQQTLISLDREVIHFKTRSKFVYLAFQLFNVCFAWTKSVDGQQHANILEISAGKTIKMFLNKIQRNFESFLLKKDLKDEKKENIKILMGFATMYAKLANGLAKLYQHEKFPAFEEYFVFYRSVKRTLGNTESGKTLNRLIVQPLSDIFKLVFKHPDMNRLFHNCIQEFGANICSDMIEDYLQACLTYVDFINANFENVEFLYTMVFGTPGIFLNTEKFNTFVVLFTAIIILSGRKSFYKNLKLYVLGNDFLLAHASTEVLILISQSSYMQSQCSWLVREFRYWQSCNNSLALLSKNPKQLHIRRLLKNYFVLSQKYCEKIRNHLPLYDSEKMDFKWSHEGRLLILGMFFQYKTEQEQTRAIQVFSTQLQMLVQNLIAGQASVDDYYKTVLHIEILANLNQQFDKNLYELILNLILNIYKVDNEHFKIHKHLLTAGCRLLQKCPNDVSKNILIMIVDMMSSNSKKLELISLTSMASLLSLCFKHSTRIIHNTSKQILNNNSFREKKIFRFVVAPDKVTSKDICMQIIKEYDSFCKMAVKEHKCNKKRELDFEDHKAKRMRLENDSGPNVKMLLEQMLLKSEEILKSTTVLDQNDSAILTTILNNVNDIFKRQKST